MVQEWQTLKELMNIKDAINKINTGRTKYQLVNFVLGQHHSKEMQYRQLLLEADGMGSNIERTNLEIEKLEAEIIELEASGIKSDAAEAQIKKHDISRKKKALEQFQNEYDLMLELFELYPKFTNEQIENNQKDYWQTRLTRVAQFQMLSRQGGVDWAQLEALQQADYIEEALQEIPTLNHITNNHSMKILGEQNDD